MYEILFGIYNGSKFSFTLPAKLLFGLHRCMTSIRNILLEGN